MEHSHLATKLVHFHTVGATCYTLYCGPKCNQKLWWVLAVVTKVFATWIVNVCIFPRGPTWCLHIDQLHPHYRMEEDADPGEAPMRPWECRNLENGSNATDMDTGDGQVSHLQERDGTLDYHQMTSTVLVLQNVWNCFNWRVCRRVKTLLSTIFMCLIN